MLGGQSLRLLSKPSGSKPQTHVLWWQNSLLDANADKHGTTNNNNNNNNNQHDIVLKARQNSWNEAALIDAFWQEQGCTTRDIEMYMNHPETLAVMLTHGNDATRSLMNDHVKIQSMPPLPTLHHDAVVDAKQDQTAMSTISSNDGIDITSYELVTTLQQRIQKHKQQHEQQQSMFAAYNKVNPGRHLPLVVLLPDPSQNTSALVEELSGAFASSPTEGGGPFVYTVPYDDDVPDKHNKKDAKTKEEDRNLYTQTLQHTKFLLADPTLSTTSTFSSSSSSSSSSTRIMNADNEFAWIWDALYSGAIPIIEIQSASNPTIETVRQDYWFLKTLLEELPVIWMERYDVLTPEYLQQEYHRIVTATTFKKNQTAAATTTTTATNGDSSASPQYSYPYHYKHLTQAYWVRTAIANVATAIEETLKRQQQQDDDNTNAYDDDAYQHVQNVVKRPNAQSHSTSNSSYSSSSSLAASANAVSKAVSSSTLSGVKVTTTRATDNEEETFQPMGPWLETPPPETANVEQTSTTTSIEAAPTKTPRRRKKGRNKNKNNTLRHRHP